MSDELIKLRQGTGGIINVAHEVDGLPIAGINSAKYELRDRDDNVVLTLAYGDGISWSNGCVVITITKDQSKPLAGFFSHQCAAVDSDGRDLMVLDGPIQFKPRKTWS